MTADNENNPRKFAIQSTARVIERMITVQRAERVARALFPGDVADGSDCRHEHGREGQPCRICAARNEAWQERVAEVRTAMIGAFS